MCVCLARSQSGALSANNKWPISQVARVAVESNKWRQWRRPFESQHVGRLLRNCVRPSAITILTPPPASPTQQFARLSSARSAHLSSRLRCQLDRRPRPPTVFKSTWLSIVSAGVLLAPVGANVGDRLDRTILQVGSKETNLPSADGGLVRGQLAPRGRTALSSSVSSTIAAATCCCRSLARQKGRLVDAH